MLPMTMTNSNNGHGTFNSVARDQFNNCSVRLATLAFTPPSSSQDGHVVQDEVVKPQNFGDTLADLTQICLFLHGRTNNVKTQSSPIHTLVDNLKDITKHLAHVAQAFDIIDHFPEPVRNLPYFLRIKAFVIDGAAKLNSIKASIRDYEVNDSEYVQADVISGLLALYNGHYQWHTVIQNIKDFLSSTSPVLYRFLRIIISGWCERLVGDGTESNRLEVLRYRVESYCSRTICHLRLEQILLRDQLGSPIAIPIDFCTEWQDLDTIVRRLCRGLDGGEYILRDEWEIIQSRDNARVDREQPISSLLTPELELAISIVFQALEASVNICPQCEFDNTQVNHGGGWITCASCDTAFSVGYFPKSPVPSSPGPTHISHSPQHPPPAQQTLRAIPSSTTSAPTLAKASSPKLLMTKQKQKRQHKFRLVSVRTQKLASRESSKRRSLSRIEKYLVHLVDAHCDGNIPKPPAGLDQQCRISSLVSQLAKLPVRVKRSVKRTKFTRDTFYSTSKLRALGMEIDHSLSGLGLRSEMSQVVRKLGNPLQFGPFQWHNGTYVNHVVFDTNGAVLSTSSSAWTKWPGKDGGPDILRYEGLNPCDIHSSAISSSGTHVAVGLTKGSLWIWDATTGHVVAGPLKGHVRPIHAIAFSPDARKIVSGSEDMSLRVWAVHRGELLLGPINGHIAWVQSVAFSPDGCRIASGSGDDTIRLWDAETGEEVSVFRGHTGTVWSVVFSADGSRIASGSWNGAIHIWDVTTHEAIRTIKGPTTNWVPALAFSPDGCHIALGASDNTARLWDIESNEQIAIFNVGEPVRSIAFAHDGKKLVSGTEYGKVHIWDTEVW